MDFLGPFTMVRLFQFFLILIFLTGLSVAFCRKINKKNNTKRKKGRCSKLPSITNLTFISKNEHLLLFHTSDRTCYDAVYKRALVATGKAATMHSDPATHEHSCVTL